MQRTGSILHPETWIVRLIFLAPFLLGILTDSTHLSRLGFHLIGTSFYGLTFISYMILWVIVPLAKSSTDYMLLKGEPINITTIQHPTSRSRVTETSRNGVNKFLKVIAYLLIGLFLICMIPIAISLLVGFVFSYHLASIILFTSVNKALAIFTILFFITLPLIAIITWLIRKIAGFNHPNKILRILFMSLHILGWGSAVFLIASLLKENNTYVSKSNKQYLFTNSDTLYIAASDPDSLQTENVLIEFNQLDHLLESNQENNYVKAVRFRYKETNDTVFSVEIEKSAFGLNRADADQHATAAVYNLNQQGNTLYLPSRVGISNKLPYHFQNIRVTVYVPKHKTLIVSEGFKKQLKHGIRTTNKSFYYHTNDNDEKDIDEIFTSSEQDNKPSGRNSKSSQSDWDSNDHETQRETIEQLNEAQREANRQIEEARHELEQSKREVQQQLDEASREAQRKIDEAQRDLERAKRETQEQLNRNSSKH